MVLIKENAVIARPVLESGADRGWTMLLQQSHCFRKEFIVDSFLQNLVLEIHIQEMDENIIGKDYNIVIVGVIQYIIRATGERVRLDHAESRNMDQLQVKFRKEKTLASLLMVQFLGSLEVGEVFVVRKHYSRELETL